MKIDFNVVIKVIARVTILFGLFGAIIPLLSFLSTKNLYQHVTESTKDEHDVEFPTLLKSPQVVYDNPAFTNFTTSNDSFVFAFPLNFLHSNIKYGLPEIELFFSLNKQHCYKADLDIYTMDILESLKGPRFDEDFILRENLVSVQGNSIYGKLNLENSNIVRLWNYLFTVTPSYNGQVKATHIADGIQKLTIGHSNPGNVVLQNAPTYLDTEHSLYVLEIKIVINYPPTSYFRETCKPNLVIFDGSTLNVKKDFKQLNTVKKFMIQHRLISLVLLFTFHYMLLSVSIFFSSSISTLVF